MSSLPTKSQTPIHVEYRNGTYYGQISSQYKRNGKGMLILDTSTVLFADWKDNQIQGMYVYLNDGIRAYGNMVNGKLEGYNIICTTKTYTGNGQTGQYANQGQPSKIRTFYGTFRNDKIYGKCILVDNDAIMICQYNNNQLQEIINKRTLRERDLYDVLRDAFPNNIYTLDEYLTVFIKNFISQLQQLEQISRYQPCINYFSKQTDEKFYGFQQISNPTKKFGILMVDNQLISIGEHNNNVLQGIGRLYSQDHIYDGAFRNGQIDGIGIDFHRTTNKFILQVHDGIQDRAQKGFGFPIRQILQYRKQFHLRSIFFFNDLAVLNLKNKFESLIGYLFIGPKRPITHQQQRQFRDTKQTQRERIYTASSRSASKRIQNSPLRQKLTRYQLESDIIEDNSPIKNRPINQYRPVDRASTYFRQRDVSAQKNKPRNQGGRFSRTGQMRDDDHYYEQGRDSRSKNSVYNGQNHISNRSQDRNQQRSNQRFSQTHNSRNKFQQRQFRQKQAYNQIIKQQQPPSRTYGVPPPQYSQSGNNFSYTQQNPSVNRNRKHTKDLVKQLQNQQKQRRLTLDEIYSKSNLYKRGR